MPAWPLAAGLAACVAGRVAAGLAAVVLEVLEQAAASRPIPAAAATLAMTFFTVMLPVEQPAWVCPRPLPPRPKPPPRAGVLRPSCITRPGPAQFGTLSILNPSRAKPWPA